jgi:HEXXH motif-containing protein
VVRQLRRAERSRRLLLLRALMDDVTKTPELFGPLPSADEAWDLLARVDAHQPAAFDEVLAHPYTGSWAGYTIRLLRGGIAGVCPLWMHVGHLHAIAAAAAIHAGLNFRISVPVWEGGAILPTLGLARLPAAEPYSVAEVRGGPSWVEFTYGDYHLVLPAPLDDDTPSWWAVRRVTTTGRRRLTVRLDDIDPYRGLHEPTLPQRIDQAEVTRWRELLTEAWALVSHHLPELADAFSVGLDSIVPLPTARFRSTSASTGEAFGSALVTRPDDGATLAAMIIHEVQHIVLGGVLHLVRLYEDDPTERFHVPWRPDPRPLSGALTGVYAFFGIAGFWRAVARGSTGKPARRAMFEFARSRGEAWHVLRVLRDDATLTPAGRRFTDGIASRLEAWQDEPVSGDLSQLADAILVDHYATWRMIHMRAESRNVSALTDAWLAGQPRPPTVLLLAGPLPTPVRDGTAAATRTDLIRLIVQSGYHDLRSVPDASTADLAYSTGRFSDAAQGYRADLARDPEQVSSWVGLGLALTALGAGPAARVLTRYPELVRAVRRQISTRSSDVPTPERLAAWIGQSVY